MLSQERGRGGLGNNWTIGFAEKDTQGRPGGNMRVPCGGGEKEGYCQDTRSSAISRDPE